MAKRPPIIPANDIATKTLLALARVEKPPAEGYGHITFRVPEGFHHEFKLYAVRNGMSMVGLFMESFAAFKKQRGD